MRQRIELIVAALKELISPETIILRNDSPVLKAEGIEQEITVLHGTNPGAFIVEANGLQFEIDLLDGQKTGLYLDQLQSHAEVAKMAEGKRVLDCFTNQGGFALACAKAGAAKVTAVDISESACAAARRNAELNGLELEVIAHNVFDFLKHGTPDYDFIILDPPSFTRNKKTLMDAMRGYKEIHLRSLKLLDKGGLLSTFCCSHHASRELFQANLVDAAVDAKKSLRLVMNHGQRTDHPVLLALPETEYLKGITAELMAGR
jgi:23S rRNA (cytosine1962-C5)-methyltransferase